MMAGFLLARAGVETIVIEKHGDFFRDFRGDTVHPSTLELMQELRLLKDFLKLPHQEVRKLGAQIGDDMITVADFSLTGATSQFIAFLPQWDFLDFLAEKARRYKTFSLRMETEAEGLIEENGRIVGVRAKDKKGAVEISAQLVIGADGRSSIIRQAAGFEVQDIGAPMDVLWLRLSRKESDPSQALGRVKAGVIFIMLNRDSYWQCGFVIKKGGFDDLKAGGIEGFRQHVTGVAPFLADRVGELNNWDDVRLLTVKVDRLKKWHRHGLICIGDSAHAMSPIGGVGINLAIQDAVAAANLLWQPLIEDRCTNFDLARVQRRRSYPTRMTQGLQVFLQNHAVSRALSAKQLETPGFLKLFNAVPALQGIPANLIGIGFRAEHITSPENFAAIAVN
jgi:2-polyprenyl-6-methoxyphenol hydroxylase-like FAD-dependent oxidoreductase